MKCQNLQWRQFAWNVKTCFLGKNKKNIISLSSAELAQRVVKVKWHLRWRVIKTWGFFFVFVFDLGFTALSRIFHLYRADRSSKVGENRRTRRKTTWPSVSRTWLSHIWPERGSNKDLRWIPSPAKSEVTVLEYLWQLGDYRLWKVSGSWLPLLS